MVWGTIVGVGPVLLTSAIALIQHKSFYQYPFWFMVAPIICLCMLPLSFAYAVVKYRALEIPVLLKRSARYFLVQRGFRGIDPAGWRGGNPDAGTRFESLSARTRARRSACRCGLRHHPGVGRNPDAEPRDPAARSRVLPQRLRHPADPGRSGSEDPHRIQP